VSSRSFRSESKFVLNSTERRRDANDFNACEDRPSQLFAMTIRPSSNPTAIFACPRDAGGMRERSWGSGMRSFLLDERKTKNLEDRG